MPSEYVLMDGSVSIEDNEDPMVSNCPSDILDYCPFGTVDTMLSWTTASDNCNLTSFTSNFNPGRRFSGWIINYDSNTLLPMMQGMLPICSFDIIVNEAPQMGDLTFRFVVDTASCADNMIDAYVKVANFDSISTMQYRNVLGYICFEICFSYGFPSTYFSF
ncbi:MAG: hypothetical protein R2784_10590 [Saprospiraceae bacterium]